MKNNTKLNREIGNILSSMYAKKLKLKDLKNEIKSFMPYLEIILPEVNAFDRPPYPYNRDWNKYNSKKDYVQSIKEDYTVHLEVIDEVLKDPKKSVEDEVAILFKEKIRNIRFDGIFTLNPFKRFDIFRYYKERKKAYNEIEKKIREEFDEKEYINTFIKSGREAVSTFKQEVEEIKSIPDEIWQKEIAQAETPEKALNEIGYVLDTGDKLIFPRKTGEFIQEDGSSAEIITPEIGTGVFYDQDLEEITFHE